MRIKEVTAGSVLLDIDPTECLLLAEACGIAGESFADIETKQTAALLSLAASYWEALALLGAAATYAVKSDELLAEWNLPEVRADWGSTPTVREVAQ